MAAAACTVVVAVSLPIALEAVRVSSRSIAQVDETPLTIWSGVYTAAQSRRGEATAARNCARCHNADLTGGQDGPSLVGPETLQAWSARTLADLFEKIRTTMPTDAPLSLTPHETVDVIAYALSQNKCPPGEKELAADVARLKQIRITSDRAAGHLRAANRVGDFAWKVMRATNTDPFRPMSTHTR